MPAALARAAAALLLLAASSGTALAAGAKARGSELSECVREPTAACVARLGIAAARRVPARDRDVGSAVYAFVETVESGELRARLMDEMERVYPQSRELRAQRRLEAAIKDAADEAARGDLDGAFRRLEPHAKAAGNPVEGRRRLIYRLAHKGFPEAAVRAYEATIELDARSPWRNETGPYPKEIHAEIVRALVDCACGPDPRPFLARITDPEQRRSHTPAALGLAGDVDAFRAYLTETLGSAVPADGDWVAKRHAIPWYAFLSRAAAARSQAEFLAILDGLPARIDHGDTLQIGSTLDRRGFVRARDALHARYGPAHRAISIAETGAPEAAAILASLAEEPNPERRHWATSESLTRLTQAGHVEGAVAVYLGSDLARGPKPYEGPHADAANRLAAAMVTVRREDLFARVLAAVRAPEQQAAIRRDAEGTRACDRVRDAMVAAAAKGGRARLGACDPEAWWPTALDRDDAPAALAALLHLDLYPRGDRDAQTRLDSVLFELAERLPER